MRIPATLRNTHLQNGSRRQGTRLACSPASPPRTHTSAPPRGSDLAQSHVAPDDVHAQRGPHQLPPLCVRDGSRCAGDIGGERGSMMGARVQVMARNSATAILGSDTVGTSFGSRGASGDEHIGGTALDTTVLLGWYIKRRKPDS